MRREKLVAVWMGERKKPMSCKVRETRPAGPQTLRRAGARAESHAPRRNGMDITWLTDEIAVGGGIWNAMNMAKVAAAGISHIIDMQIEFDDTPLAAEYSIAVLWNATDDDFEHKPAELFERGVEFARKALESGGKVLIHCAAGVHRAPMMAAALLGTMGWELADALRLIETRRQVVDFPDVYVRSVEQFLEGREKSFTTEGSAGH